MTEIKKKSSLLEVALFYGILLALLRVGVDVLLKVMDVSSMTYYLGYVIGFILEIIIVIVAIKAYRKNNDGYLSFVESIKIGMIALILTGIAFFAGQMLFDPDFAGRKAIEMVEKMNPEQLQATIDQIEEAKNNPKYLFSLAMTILYFTFIGFVISAIAGAALKKSKED